MVFTKKGPDRGVRENHLFGVVADVRRQKAFFHESPRSHVKLAKVKLEESKLKVARGLNWFDFLVISILK